MRVWFDPAQMPREIEISDESIAARYLKTRETYTDGIGNTFRRLPYDPNVSVGDNQNVH